MTGRDPLLLTQQILNAYSPFLIDWKLRSKGPVKMTGTTPPHAAHLTPDEQQFLARFFRRALNLHARGVVSPESVLDYLQLVTDALDPETPKSFAAIRIALEDAWRQADG